MRNPIGRVTNATEDSRAKKKAAAFDRGLHSINFALRPTDSDLPESVRPLDFRLGARSNLSLANRKPVRAAIRLETIPRTP
jgi:hypothetical protein